MKKIDWLRGAAAAASVCLLLAGCAGEGTSSPGVPASSTPQTYTTLPQRSETFAVDDSHVRFLGRYLKNPADGRVHFDWSASGFSFTFTGSSVKAVLYTPKTYAVQETARPHVAVYVDGGVEPVTRISLSQDSMEVELVPEMGEGTHTVEVRKASAMSYSGPFSLDSVTVTGVQPSMQPAGQPQRRIEFIGDSITCGYGVLASAQDASYKSIEEDGTQSFAGVTARSLGADYSLVCVSGNGVYCDLKGRQKMLMPEYYPYADLKLDNDWGSTEKTLWGDEQFPADAVVIHLGSNDSQGVLTTIQTIDGRELTLEERQLGFREAYQKLVETVRQTHPDAAIFCVIGGMPSIGMYALIQDAVSAYKEASGDGRVYTYEFETNFHTVENGIRAGHPSATVHRMMAGELAGQMKAVLGW